MELNRLIYSLAAPVEKWINKKKVGTMLEEGAVAPDFTVKAHNGRDVSLHDFRGKNVVLWFFPKADTPG